MSEIKITKKLCLDEWSNSTCSGSEWVVYGRIYNREKTRYYSFRFVLWFDYACDLWDSENEKEIPLSECMENAIYSFIPDNLSFDDEKAIARFIDDCNATIEQYNAKNRRRYSYAW